MASTLTQKIPKLNSIRKSRQSIAGMELTNISDVLDAFAGISRDFFNNGVK